MVRIFIFVLALLFSESLSAQSLPENVSQKTCSCLGAIRTLDSLEMRFKQCVGPAMAAAISEQDKRFELTVENIQRTTAHAFELLPSLCPSVRMLVVAHKTQAFYTASPSEAANRHYEKALALIEASDFNGAISELKKAIREDDQFVMAIDNLGMCYRSLNELREASVRYRKSLDIFPEGEFALTNLAAIYLMQNDPSKAIDYYDKLIFFHPDNPEGYYGRSRSFLMKEKYEEALEPMCQAHRIYDNLGSQYLTQSKAAIDIIYAKMRSSGKENIFRETVSRYGIQFNDPISPDGPK